MQIGIIGTGNMGRALGRRWARGGHRVLFGSRDLEKARAVAADCSAQTGDHDAAAAFGDVVLYTVREVLPSALLRDPQVLAGRVVVDCNNTAVLGLDLPDPRGRPGFRFRAASPSLTERLAADAPQARWVKAFNTIPSRVIELDRDTILRHRISVFLCADDPAARTAVQALAEDLGFVGVDCGGLENAGSVEALADVVRFQILAMGRQPITALSLQDLGEAGP